jgi:hypothetical protein
MKPKPEWLVEYDDDVDVFAPDDDDEQASLWRRLVELGGQAVMFISIVVVLSVPPILALPALAIVRWIVKTLEGSDLALKRVWADVLSYLEWLCDTGRKAF